MSLFKIRWQWGLYFLIILGFFPTVTLARVDKSKANKTEQMKWVEKTLKKMSLKEKVGQMIMVPFSGYYINEEKDSWKRIEEYITQDHVGGFIMFGGNVYDAAVVIFKMQRLAKIPLLISSDFERGAGNQIGRAVPFPTNMAVAATRSEENAYLQGKITALEARAIGIHQTYAPVMDVNNNPDNPIINVRSYGESPQLVARLGLAFIKGCQEFGLIATAKHFPGHGDTSIDSHSGLPVVDVERARLDSVELAPFKQAIASGVQSIMVGHIHLPRLDPWPQRPASLSRDVVTDLLRKELGFQGLIVTDAMGMGGVTNGYTASAAAVNAVKAGVDLVLLPPAPEVAIEAIVEQVEQGYISQERIDDSVSRILQAKARLGLHRNKYVSVGAIGKVVGSEEFYRVARKIAEESITLVKNNNDVIPLTLTDSTKVLSMILSSGPFYSAEPPFLKQVKKRFPWAETLILDSRLPLEAYNQALQKAKAADVVLCGAFVKYRVGERSIDLLQQQTDFVDSLSTMPKPFVLVSFGSPYILRRFPNVTAYLCTYWWAEPAQVAAVKALFGEIDIRGKLPISIPGLYPSGHGIELKKREKMVTFREEIERGKTLKVGLPEEAGMSATKLKEVDRVIEEAIKDRAFPGAALLVARRGLIVTENAFGNMDYSPTASPMQMNTIFDLASLTKVVATTTATMILYDRGQIDLEAPVVNYIPEFGQIGDTLRHDVAESLGRLRRKGKDHIRIKHLLTHCSGLPDWRPFFQEAKSPQDLLKLIYETELEYETGTKTLYSDLGIITLGKVIEKISGKSLDQFCREEIFEPLGMKNTMFNPPKELRDRIAPTEIDPWRGRLLRGEVHDRNAYALGGVAAHAGLFSTARDLAIFLQMLLNGGIYGEKRIIEESTIKMFTQRQNLVEGSSRALGWDTPSPPSSSGHYFSANSFGHTGFTGTSVWVDPHRELFVVFLTNRVHPTRDNIKIRAVRPRVHDAVMLAITDEEIRQIR